MTSLRERIAIVFMTVSVIATLALGGAVIHELNRKPTSVVANGALGSATGPQAGAATDQGAAAQAAGGTAGSAASAGSAGQTAGSPGVARITVTGCPSASEADRATRSSPSPATASETMASDVELDMISVRQSRAPGCGQDRRRPCRESHPGTRATVRRTGTPRGRARRRRRSPCSSRTSAAARTTRPA